MGFTKTLGMVLSTIVVIAISGPVTASPTPEKEKAKARELVYRGDELFAQERLGEALVSYLHADEIMRVPTTRIEVAKTLAALGRLTEARDTAVAVEKMPLRDDEPFPFLQARRRASNLVRDLDRRIPTLSLEVVPSVSNRTVYIDKIAVPETIAWAPLRMEPGRHVITVEAPGFSTVAKTVDVKEGEATTLRVVLPESSRGPSGLGIGGLIVSGLGLTAGVVTGALFIQEHAALEDACSAHASSCTDEAFAQTNALGWASGASLVAGVAAGLVGGIAFGVDASQAPEPRVTTRLGPGYVQLTATF